MNTKHIIGYILLALGVIIIGYSLFASHRVFMADSNVPEIFKAPIIQEQTSFGAGTPEEQVNAMVEEQFAKLIPADTIFKTLNVFAWSIFAGILIFGGSQLAGLGIKLLRIPRQEKPN